MDIHKDNLEEADYQAILFLEHNNINELYKFIDMINSKTSFRREIGRAHV